MKSHPSARTEHHDHPLPRLLWPLTLVAFITASWRVPSSSALYLPPSSIFPSQDQGYGYRNSFAKRTIFPTEDEGHGYRNYFAKRTIFPTEDAGHGYRNSFAKRTIFPTEDQGHGYRNYFAKRTIFPTEDAGHGYRNSFAKRTIFPTEDQGHGYRNYFAKRTIFPTEDEGHGYHNSFAKRIIPIDDQGHGFRNYRAKRIFPTEGEGHGYHDYYSKRTIVPIDDQGHGYRNYRAKRLSPDSSSVCNLCIMTYDPDYCIRCWWSKSAIVPIYAKKRSDSNMDSEEDSDYAGEDSDLSDSAEGAEVSVADLEQSGLEGREEKRGNYSAGFLGAGNWGESSSQPLDRDDRGSAVCGCCYMSRLSNTQCCHMCHLTTKRMGNPPVTSEDQVSDVPSKRAYMINPDCFCCMRNGGYGCCSRCFAK